MRRYVNLIGLAGFALFCVAGCAGKAAAPAPAPSVEPGPPARTDADAYEKVIKDHKADFRVCYEQEVRGMKTKKTGQVETEFTIGADGKVGKASIRQSTLKLPKTEACVLEVLRKIDFPPPEGGRVLQIRYPFKFKVTK